jgi:hypothetical protein
MRPHFQLFAVVSVFCGCRSEAAMIQYTATDSSGSTWRYDYSVTNNDLSSPVGEVTIFFGLGSYSNISSPGQPSTWSSVVAQPDPAIPADGFFDSATSSGGISLGATLSGFSVQFTWLGTGSPGAQMYDVVDPVSFATLESGTTVSTVPIPGALGLLASALSCGLVCRALLGKKTTVTSRTCSA